MFVGELSAGEGIGEGIYIFLRGCSGAEEHRHAQSTGGDVEPSLHSSASLQSTVADGVASFLLLVGMPGATGKKGFR